jgi:hypothetical protein
LAEPPLARSAVEAAAALRTSQTIRKSIPYLAHLAAAQAVLGAPLHIRNRQTMLVSGAVALEDAFFA